MRALCSFLAILLFVGKAAAIAAPAPLPARGPFAGTRRGVLPTTTDFSHLRQTLQNRRSPLRKSKILRAAEAIPERWDSREKGWVSPVKNQGNYGTCWSFATMAALETAFLRETAGVVTNDFSENHLARHNVGFNLGFGNGGNNQIAAALVTAWRDPLLESEDPYPYPASGVELPPAAHVQNIIWLPERFCPIFSTTANYEEDACEDNRAVDAAYKRAVMAYGAVSICYLHSWGSYNSSTAAHCLTSKSAINANTDGGHAVTLIGWDDAYPVENFVAGNRPAGPGAFLVKNSWGTGSATTNGYTWISYYDEALFNQIGAAYPCPEEPVNYGRVYQYDPCGQIGSWNACDTDEEFAAGMTENWCANVFTAVATGLVEAVGFYALSADTEYTLRVYRGCTTIPSDGELIAEQEGSILDSGFTTLRLETPVSIEAAGEKFAVVLRLHCPDYAYPLPVECTWSDNQGLWCTCTANAGESFLSKNGEAWTDFQKYVPTGNFCIKAYTRYGSDGDTRNLIAAVTPTETKLTARLGEAISFAVAAEGAAVAEGGLTYVWKVNGVAQEAVGASFSFTPDFSDHGSCVVECLVRQGAAVEACSWTVLVNADLHVAAGSSCVDPDGSVARPFATIAEACAAAFPGDRVLVGPGVYVGTLEGPSALIEIRSKEGPEKTVLDAQGEGRCFYAGQNLDVCLSGFSLINAQADGLCGGGAYGGVLENCMISNCVAALGGGAYYTQLTCCRVTGCRAEVAGGAIADSMAENCLLDGNAAGAYGGAASGYDFGSGLYGCTVVGNRAPSGGGVDVGCTCGNSILWSNDDGAGHSGNWESVLTSQGVSASELYFCCTTPFGFAGGSGCVLTDPLFADATNGNWQLTARSACVDSGLNAAVAVTNDLTGLARIVGGQVDMGCFEYAPQMPDWPLPAVAAGASPRDEAAAVAETMKEVGFTGTQTNVIWTAAQYGVFAAWADEKRLLPADLNASSTAFVSAALDAEGLLTAEQLNLRVTDLSLVGEGVNLVVTLSMDAYDAARVSPELLRAAVGVVGADSLQKTFSSDELEVSLAVREASVDLTVRPPVGKSAYFLQPIAR